MKARKIAVASRFLQRIGGVETYLTTALPELARKGYELLLFVDSESVSDDTIHSRLPDCPVLISSQIGAEESLRRLNDWRPDIVYLHGLSNPALERAVSKTGRCVSFLHDYRCMCISGRKRFAFPVMRPCSRTFGSGCLIRYHARRCGGLNPIVMFREYAKTSQRLQNVLHSEAVVTHSVHMYDECLKHAVPPERLFRIPLGTQYDDVEMEPSRDRGDADRGILKYFANPELPLKLLFCSRLDRDKGAEIVVESALELARLLDRQVELTIVGEGPSHSVLRQQVARLHSNAEKSKVNVFLKGWLSRTEVEVHLRSTHLLAFASLWPEPFGLSGIEAGRFGVPVAGFAVGGVTTWLKDGVNGFSAPGDPPTKEGLARALVKCVSSETIYRSLAKGALEQSANFRSSEHFRRLFDVFELVLHRDRP